jgi:hypothetical protein
MARRKGMLSQSNPLARKKRKPATPIVRAKRRIRPQQRIILK